MWSVTVQIRLLYNVSFLLFLIRRRLFVLLMRRMCWQCDQLRYKLDFFITCLLLFRIRLRLFVLLMCRMCWQLSILHQQYRPSLRYNVSSFFSKSSFSSTFFVSFAFFNFFFFLYYYIAISLFSSPGLASSFSCLDIAISSCSSTSVNPSLHFHLTLGLLVIFF